MVRTILSIVTGLVISFAVVALMELLSQYIYHIEVTPDFNVAELPMYVKLYILVGWALGAFIGGLGAAAIHPAKKMFVSVIVGVFFMAATLLNLITIPHPVWIWIIGLWQAVPFAYLGGTIVKQKAINQ